MIYDFQRGDFIQGKFFTLGRDIPIFDMPEDDSGPLGHPRYIENDQILLVREDCVNQPVGFSTMIKVLDLEAGKSSMVYADHYRLFNREKP